MKDLATIIKDHPFMADMKEDHFDVLAECAAEVHFEAGEVIFRQGDVADKFFLIVEGEVVLESQEGVSETCEVQTLEAGDVLGWSWLFAPYMWHFTARARRPVQAISFNGAHLLIACEENHELGFDLMKRIVQVVIQNLQAARRKLVALEQRRTPAHA